ncbi:hypothetical protein GCM10011611_07850 [Aliidongia dinghuensis]|uniref:Uncharacterized protein n=1 Tax=Aliidongia dinghuensis TaxID=1867774 RepID=A0A8J2YQA5_9PROT|nr:hypothetical protein [Aliidongia dinghuensis]GGF04867.1 hypothetical protein GCM10011611_07850 [Aliidongia dinghuensis]
MQTAPRLLALSPLSPDDLLARRDRLPAVAGLAFTAATLLDPATYLAMILSVRRIEAPS